MAIFFFHYTLYYIEGAIQKNLEELATQTLLSSIETFLNHSINTARVMTRTVLMRWFIDFSFDHKSV